MLLSSAQAMLQTLDSCLDLKNIHFSRSFAYGKEASKNLCRQWINHILKYFLRRGSHCFHNKSDSMQVKTWTKYISSLTCNSKFSSVFTMKKEKTRPSLEAELYCNFTHGKKKQLAVFKSFHRWHMDYNFLGQIEMLKSTLWTKY